MEKRALKAEKQRDDALDKVKELQHQFYETAVRLEEEQGKNLKLRAQINRDYENSSIPSSKTLRKKKITNSREKTGRKPGGQPGHKGHCRKKQEPTRPAILLPPPEIVLEDNSFKKTSKTIIKQRVGIRMLLDVTEYHADVYYSSQTGERVHAPFPAGVIDDVNYDGSIRAFLFLLNNDCCTSIDKSRQFLSGLTGGKLNISKGMVSRLSREFALKTEAERRAAYADMLLSPVMHTDCTNGRENGKGCKIYVCAPPDGKALYFAREKKGHEGVKDTVTEDYQGILVHDHDRTFYNYGTDHQECLAHVLRYLKGSMDNEPDRTWNKDMHSLVQEMVRMGEIKPEEARNHPDKNIITRAVGVLPEVTADFFEISLKPGDEILMCSDGLTNMIEDDEIRHIVLGQRDIVEKAEKLIETANRNGGKDNITVVLIEPFSDEVKEC